MMKENTIGTEIAVIVADAAEPKVTNRLESSTCAENVTHRAAEDDRFRPNRANEALPNLERFPKQGATPEAILDLVKKARRDRAPVRASQVPWGERVAAITMLSRGVRAPDMHETFGVTVDEVDQWITDCKATRPICEFEGHVCLWATMLDQNPEALQLARKVVNDDYVAVLDSIRPGWRCLSKSAEAHALLTGTLLHDPRFRKIYFEDTEHDYEVIKCASRVEMGTESWRPEPPRFLSMPQRL